MSYYYLWYTNFILKLWPPGVHSIFYCGQSLAGEIEVQKEACICGPDMKVTHTNQFIDMKTLWYILCYSIILIYPSIYRACVCLVLVDCITCHSIYHIVFVIAFDIQLSVMNAQSNTQPFFLLYFCITYQKVWLMCGQQSE